LTVHGLNLEVYCTERGDKRQYARVSSFSWSTLALERTQVSCICILRRNTLW